jgi:hypothetical protein
MIKLATMVMASTLAIAGAAYANNTTTSSTTTTNDDVVATTKEKVKTTAHNIGQETKKEYHKAKRAITEKIDTSKPVDTNTGRIEAPLTGAAPNAPVSGSRDESVNSVTGKSGGQ